jgi:hypothetical protein
MSIAKVDVYAGAVPGARIPTLDEDTVEAEPLPDRPARTSRRTAATTRSRGTNRRCRITV